MGAFFLVDQSYLGGRPVGRQGLVQEAIYHQKEERLQVGGEGGEQVGVGVVVSSCLARVRREEDASKL